MSDDDLQLATDDEARIEAILRSMTEADLELESPPLDLWDDIDAAVRLESLSVDPSTAAAPAAPEGAKVIDITSRFRRGSAYFAAAAAAVVVVIGAVVVAASSNDDTSEVVGEAELVWDDGFVAEGTDVTISTTILAEGEVDAVRIDDGSLPTRADEDLELWLIGVDDAGELTIQTLGVIDDASGTYEVPADFDPDAFETVLVDISFEPRDGVETHSGASIVRGPIVEA
ncbi:MAG: anti-sigma factor [Actinomycetota bacterium]